MEKILFYLVIHSLILIVSTQSNITINLTDDQTTVLWEPSESENVLIEANNGYQIQVDILNLNLHGENNSYVIFKNLNGYNDTEDTLLTYSITSKPQYFYNNNKIQANYIRCNLASNCTTDDVLSVRFTRVGELTTTTTNEPITSTDILPTPSPTESSILTVYIYGRSPESFNITFQNELENMLLQMAIDYCKIQLCPLNNSITKNNINIEVLEPCSILWNDQEHCMKLLFSIPINLMENATNSKLWYGYQLDVDHLNIMWQTYARRSLELIGLSPFPVPNVNEIFTHQIIAYCVILVLMVILIICYRSVMNKLMKKKRRRSTVSYTMDGSTLKNKELSLQPHYLQETPPLFASDFPYN